MKTLQCTFIALFFCSVNLLANEVNDEKYLSTMQKNIDVLYDAKTLADYQTVINAFERIAGVETKKWEPLYYAAFGYIMMSDMETSLVKKDEYLDLAIIANDKAKALAPAESELLAIEGFIHMMRVAIDPASRGPKFAGLSMQSLQKAVELNNENPRALALLAQMQYGTAQFFGSSTEEACKTGSLAIVKFETYKSENPLAPVWGKKMAEGLTKNCQ
ncbi:MAG TPA: hypothetical protein VD927_01635 [Chryseosolibacter sp.]|nr:hypothetical protein [Chryseosolibacter sp.]